MPAQAAYRDGVFKRLVSTEEWDRLPSAMHLSNTCLNSADTRHHLDREYGEIREILAELGLARLPAARQPARCATARRGARPV